MVHHTRLGTIAGTLGIMRMALAQAVHHTAGRRVFQKTLLDQAAMANVITDLAIEYEAAVVLVLRIARAFDGADGHERALARLGVALAKFWLTKRCPGFVFECMESHGGAGYVEDGPMPRLFRESPLNAIWEGSGNVIALDVLRTLRREAVAREAFAAGSRAGLPGQCRCRRRLARAGAAPECAHAGGRGAAALRGYGAAAARRAACARGCGERERRFLCHPAGPCGRALLWEPAGWGRYERDSRPSARRLGKQSCLENKDQKTFVLLGVR